MATRLVRIYRNDGQKQHLSGDAAYIMLLDPTTTATAEMMTMLMHPVELCKLPEVGKPMEL